MVHSVSTGTHDSSDAATANRQSVFGDGGPTHGPAISKAKQAGDRYDEVFVPRRLRSEQRLQGIYTDDACCVFLRNFGFLHIQRHPGQPLRPLRQ